MARLPWRSVPTARLACAAMILLAGAGCRTESPPPGAASSARDPGDDLDRLTGWMSGSFTSAAQAARDPAFRVVELHMTPIWTDRTDGRWLYVEQAVAATPEAPYRQRVYRVVAVDDGADPVRLRSDVYEFAGDPLRHAGAWRDPTRLGDLGPDDLLPRDGCSIIVRPEGDAYVGGTEGHGCPSSLRGASYATSEVRIAEGMLTSWDRGWDAAGRQVWGAVTGAYEFVKVAPAP